MGRWPFIISFRCIHKTRVDAFELFTFSSPAFDESVNVCKFSNLLNNRYVTEI